MAGERPEREPVASNARERTRVQGTIVCWDNDTEEGRGALELAAELSQRMGLRLVVAHVFEGNVPLHGDESVAMKGSRAGAARLVAEHGLADRAELRSAVGDTATLLGRIAAEEAADVILVGARSRGRLRRGFESRLAVPLDAAMPVPVVIAPPRPRRGAVRQERRLALRSSWMARSPSLFWRVFVVNAALLGAIALLLLFSPFEIDAPIKTTQALIIVAALLVAVAANAILLRRAVAPLDRLAQRMDTVDLLRPGQRLPVGRGDEVGRVVAAFNRMLERLESERQQSGRRVLAAQEAERVGIARDLHDEVGQLLTGVLLQLNAIVEAAPAHRVELDEAKQAVRRALDEVRRISSALRPEMLEELGLVSALTELSTTFARVSGVRVERQFDRSLPKLSPDTELAIYRIAQESLTNVARHANASRVTITLERGRDSLVLRVVDDGRGFAGAPEEHGGMRSLRERALLVDAALAIKPAARGGVEMRLEVPEAPVVHVAGFD
jgi:two-component system sensor histidine kinase UhpB